MQNGYAFNGLEFITAGGPVSILVAAVLLAMSVASWYLIVTKGLQAKRQHSAYRDYARKFWNAPSLNAALKIEQQTALANLAKPSHCSSRTPQTAR